MKDKNMDDSMFALKDNSTDRFLGEETSRGKLVLGPTPYLFSSIDLRTTGFQMELFRRAAGYTIKQLEIVQVM